ncbi:DNA replication complex GINS protein PSF1 [Entamoeba marina]
MASTIHEKMVEALKELKRTDATLPPPNIALIEKVKAELNGFVMSDSLSPAMVYANSLLLRLRHCYEAYLTERLKRVERIRWEIGSTLPNNIIINMMPDEVKYFKKYCKLIGNFSTETDVEIVADSSHPPYSSYVSVTARPTKSSRNLPHNPSIYTTSGLVKLNNEENQMVIRSPAVDAMIHLGVLQVVEKDKQT